MMVKYSSGLLMTKNRPTAKQGQATFLSLWTLASEYNKIVGHGGVLTIRESFDIPYKSEIRVSQKLLLP